MKFVLLRLDTIEKSIELYREQWEKERAAKDKAIADAVANKSSLPANYWLNEHRAHGLYISALELRELLND